jgi:hypothetical protein
MINISELKEKIIGLLKSHSTGEHSYSTPHNPVCVMYFGKASAVCHEAVCQKLTDGWGGSANQIAFYILETDGLKDLNAEDLSQQTFGLDMTNLLRCNVYCDTSSISLFCIFDTDCVDCENPAADFEKWYYAIENIKVMLNSPIKTMLLIAVNDELNHQKKSVLIKQRLCEIYQKQDNTHSYDCVFVIGRRLRSGAYSRGFGGDLLANIILLSNTSGVNCGFYKSAPALTAAYESSAKPVGDIGIITLKVITAKLSQMLQSDMGNPLKNDESLIAKILEIDKGQSELYERIYTKINQFLPPNEVLFQLPGKPDFNASFDTADEMSYNCLSTFLHNNHFAVINEQMALLKDEIVSQLTARICRLVSAGRLYDGFDSGVISAVLDKAQIMLDSNAELSALDAVRLKLKSLVAAKTRCIILDTLESLCLRYKSCIDAFLRIKRSVDMMPAVRETGTGMHLVKFYTDRANRYLNLENCTNVFENVFSLDNRENDILDVLFTALESCFVGDNVYRFSYIDEMYERLGVNDIHTATNQIIGELIENLDEKIRFYSATVFANNRMFEAYFLRVDAVENSLYERLKKRELPANTQRTFFNAQSNDIIESMWFYECRENDLLAEL